MVVLYLDLTHGQKVIELHREDGNISYTQLTVHSISSKKCVFDDCSTYSVTILSTLFNFKTFTPVEESAHHRRK